MNRPSLVIVSPALADANNGNWQTARRWQRMLSSEFETRIVKQWPDAQASGVDRLMLALHARRSAVSIRAWAKAHGVQREAPGLVLALTGTDLYRDIRSDASARGSLELASRLLVLQELAPRALPPAYRSKTQVVFQSCAARQTLHKTGRHLRVVMVGHLREEKSPQTLCEVATLLQERRDILIDHIGEPLDPALGELARQTAASCPSYRWLGGLSHQATLGHIQRAHLLVHASLMEGGAHVVMEAIRSGTPVLASDIDGNVGMLGADYRGYFPVGNASALAQMLRDCRAAQVESRGLAPIRRVSNFLTKLARQCDERASLFSPDAESAALHSVLAKTLNNLP